MSTSHKWVRATASLGFYLIQYNPHKILAYIETGYNPKYAIADDSEWTPMPKEIQTEEDMKAYVEVLVRMGAA